MLVRLKLRNQYSVNVLNIEGKMKTLIGNLLILSVFIFGSCVIEFLVFTFRLTNGNRNHGQNEVLK